MAHCPKVQQNLTAWVDGELSDRRARKIRNHVEGCAQCASEAESVRASIALQARLLPQVVQGAASVSPALWSRVDGRLAEAAALGSRWLEWVRPLVIVGAVVVLSLVGFVSVAGGPQAVLIPLGVKAPPAVVKRAPAMFTQYRMIEKLDILENFDTVDAVPLDDNDASKG